MNLKIRKQVGNRIRQFRKQIGMTQEQLAHEANLERSYMGYVERGQANPTLEKLSKVARVLKLSLSELFTFKKR